MKIGVYGVGAYAIALVSALIKNNADVTMWTKFSDEYDHLVKYNKSDKVFPFYKIDSSVKYTMDLEEVSKNKDLLIIAIPTPFVRSLLKEASLYIEENTKILIASKGIEQNSNLFINELIMEYVKNPVVGVISGPSFAIDMINNDHVGLSIATNSSEMEDLCMNVLSNNELSLIRSNDIVGTELCGAIKNVFAIGSGILNGLGVSDSTIAMYLTHAASDMKFLIEKIGGDSDTAYSLAGIGDLILTCTCSKSRNYSYGFKLATLNREEVDLYSKNNTIEGINSLIGICELLDRYNFSVALFDILKDIIFNREDASLILNYFKLFELS